MRFAILGSGAIGSYMGAALARGGADVVLIARGPQLEALRERGVRVLSPRGDFEARVPATDDLDAVADADVVVLGVKAYTLPEIAPRLGEVLGDESIVLPAQNGVPWWFFQSFGGMHEGTVLESVDPGGVVSRSIDPSRVVGCVSYPAAELEAPGVVRHVEGTRFAIGEPDGAAVRPVPGDRRRVRGGWVEVPDRVEHPRPALAEADRQRRLQPHHGTHRRLPRRARARSGGRGARTRGHGGVRARRRERWRSSCRSRSSDASKRGSPWEIIGRRCCRTSSTESRSRSTA